MQPPTEGVRSGSPGFLCDVETHRSGARGQTMNGHGHLEQSQRLCPGQSKNHDTVHHADASGYSAGRGRRQAPATRVGLPPLAIRRPTIPPIDGYSGSALTISTNSRAIIGSNWVPELRAISASAWSGWIALWYCLSLTMAS